MVTDFLATAFPFAATFYYLTTLVDTLPFLISKVVCFLTETFLALASAGSSTACFLPLAALPVSFSVAVLVKNWYSLKSYSVVDASIETLSLSVSFVLSIAYY